MTFDWEKATLAACRKRGEKLESENAQLRKDRDDLLAAVNGLKTLVCEGATQSFIIHSLDSIVSRIEGKGK